MNPHPPPENMRRVAGPGRPKGSRNRNTIEIQAIAKSLVENPAYRRSLKRRLIDGKAPHMETVLFYYAYGKPVERHEITGTDGGPIEVAPVRERVSRRLEEMAARLEITHHAIIGSPIGEPSGNGASGTPA